MEKYIQQLLADIVHAIENISLPFVEKVLQTNVPERIQYAAMRDNFNQEAKIKHWHMGFFELCRLGTEHGKCALGEYCQCAFYAELFSGFTDEELSPEEERVRELEIEIKHLKRKHSDDWMKYYPYHL